MLLAQGKVPFAVAPAASVTARIWFYCFSFRPWNVEKRTFLSVSVSSRGHPHPRREVTHAQFTSAASVVHI